MDPTVEEIKIEKPEVKFESLQTEYRQETAKRMIEMMTAPGSRIGPEVAAKFIGVNPRSIYRWRDRPALFLPAYELCGNINAFLDTVRELREACPVFIRAWKGGPKGGLRDFPESFLRAMVPEKLRLALDDKSLNDAERAEWLVIRSLRILAAGAVPQKSAEVKEGSE